MEHFIKVILERVARFRSRLNSIESEMDQHGTQKPPKLWNDLVQISTALDREENKAKAALESRLRRSTEPSQQARGE